MTLYRLGGLKFCIGSTLKSRRFDEKGIITNVTPWSFLISVLVYDTPTVLYSKHSGAYVNLRPQPTTIERRRFRTYTARS